MNETVEIKAARKNGEQALVYRLKDGTWLLARVDALTPGEIVLVVDAGAQLDAIKLYRVEAVTKKEEHNWRLASFMGKLVGNILALATHEASRFVGGQPK